MVTETPLRDRTHLTLLAWEHARRSTIGQILRSPLLRWRFGGPAIEKFLLIPQDIRTADPSFVTEIYHGHFGLSGTVAITNGASPFAIRPPNLAWQRELHGFSWLRHLSASEDDLSRTHARSLIKEWITLTKRSGGVAWEFPVLTRRIISWLMHADYLLDSSDDVHYRMVMRSFTYQARYLSGAINEIPDGLPRLNAYIALVFVGLCVGEQDVPLKDNVHRFCRELDRQIFEDGGHISRNPGVLVELLLDLLPLKQCFIARGEKPPKTLMTAIKRILPMVHFLRLGDGCLAHFNGMAASLPDALATVLAYDDNMALPRMEAPQSCYCRLEKGGTILIMDTGMPPPLLLSGEAHAGCLSFEMSTGLYPLIVNSGAPGPANRDWTLTARTTPTHSTLTIANASSARLIKRKFLKHYIGASLLTGPRNVKAEIKEEQNRVQIRASHDGYDERFGLTHNRIVSLHNSGAQIDGEDQLIAPNGVKGLSNRRGWRVTVHFHVHPDVRVTRAEDGKNVILTLPNNDCWKFSAEKVHIAIEESLFLADYRGSRQTVQIVLKAICNRDMRIRWCFKELSSSVLDAPHATSDQAEQGTKLRLVKSNGET